MHGQTPSALKILSRAYRAVLRRMWLKEALFTVTLGAAAAGVINRQDADSEHTRHAAASGIRQGIIDVPTVARTESPRANAWSSGMSSGSDTSGDHTFIASRQGMGAGSPGVTPTFAPAPDGLARSGDVSINPLQAWRSGGNTDLMQGDGSSTIHAYHHDEKDSDSPSGLTVRTFTVLVGSPRSRPSGKSPTSHQKQESDRTPGTGGANPTPVTPLAYTGAGSGADNAAPATVGGVPSPLTIPEVYPAGIFVHNPANIATVDPRERTGRVLMIYLHDANTPDMYNASFNAYGATSAYDYMLKITNQQRQWFAAASGGKFDTTYTYLDSGPLTYNPATGQPWTQYYDPVDAILAANNLNKSSYDFIQVIMDNMATSTYTSPYFVDQTGSMSGLTTGGGKFWDQNYSRLHEFGHAIGLGHAHSDSGWTGANAQYGYTYDFTTKTYVAGTGVTNPIGSPMVPMGIALQDIQYGNPTDVMAGGSQQYNPRDKAKVGWIDKRQFAIVTPGANNSTTNITIHNPDQLTAVTNGASGDALQYGVVSGYADTPYAASFVRKALKFIPNATNDGGRWVSVAQVVDLNYVQSNATTYGIEVRIDGNYYGTIQLGQSIADKDFGKLLLLQGTGSVGQGAVAPYDLRALDLLGPDNPLRFSSSWYDILFQSNNTDSVGDFGTLAITTHTGSVASGLRWNAGDGVWQNGGGNIFTDLDNANASAAWAGGRHAVFGSSSLAAGVVTVSGTVAPQSLTFKPSLSGNYTLTGGAINLGASGMNVEASATIASALNLADIQAWEILGGKTLTLSGTVNANGNELDILGQGALALSGAGTYGTLGIFGNTVNQSFSQTVATLGLHQSSNWNINSGTLTISSSTAKDAGFDGCIALNSGGTSLADSPDLMFTGGTANADILVNTGVHFVGATTNVSMGGELRGAGTFAFNGNGDTRAFTLNNPANSFTGDFQINRGILAVGSYGRLSGLNGLVFNVASGQSGKFYTGPNDTTLTSLSTAATHAGSATVANNSAYDATLTVNQTTNTTYSGAIVDGAAGRLALNKTGTGILSLTGGNSAYSGGTTVSGGVLRIGGSGAIGTGAMTLNGGMLSVDQRQGLSLTKLGGTAMDTTTAVSGGTYSSDFSPLHTPSSTLVSGTFAYSGKIFLIAGDWSFGKSFDDGAFLKINGQQIFSNASWSGQAYGSLTVATDGWYDIDLRLYNTGGGGGGPYANGSWDTYKGIGVKQGAQTSSGADYTAFNPGALGLKLRDLNYVSNAVILAQDSPIEILDQDAIRAETVFTGGVTGIGGLTKTGAGTLTLSGSGNTYAGATHVSVGTLAAASTNAFSAASAITLANAAGVTLDLRNFNQTVAALSGGGGAGGEVLLGTATLTTGANNASTAFAGVISGTGGLTKTGTGTMSLSGQNTYTGTTRVTGGGVLNLDYAAGAPASGRVADSSSLTLDNGVLRVTGRADANIVQNFAGLTIVNGTNAVNLVANGAASLDVNVGAITRTGTGTVDFSGLTGAAVGARIITSSGNVGLMLDGGANWATYNGSDWATRDANGYIVAYTGYADVPTNNGVIANDAVSKVRVIEGGPGTVTLQNSGVTSIASLLMSAGVTSATVDMTGKTLSVSGIAVAANARGLTLGAGANAGTLTSSTNALQLISNSAFAGLVVNATIADNASNPLNVAVSGGVNGGATYFAGTNTYTGATVVTNNGKLHLGAGGTSGGLGAGSVSIDAGSELVLDRSNEVTVANVIGGAGVLRKLNSNTTTLAGANTLSGVTFVDAGVLQVGTGASGSLGTGAASVAAGASLAYGRTDSVAVSTAVSGAGTLRQSGSGTTRVTGDITVANVAVDAGTLQIGDAGAAGTLASASVVNNATLAVNRTDTVTISSAISGTGLLRQAGAGTTVLTGTNSYGATSIDAGTLQVGAGGASGTLGAGAVTDNAALVFSRSDDITVANAIGGTGTLTTIGSGKLILTGNNTYSGGTSLANGVRLQVGDGGSSGTLGTGVVDINGGAVVTFDRSDTLTAANVFTGSAPGGDLRQAGAGTLILTGNSTRFGNTYADAGVLQIGNGGTAGSLGSGQLINSASVIFNRSDAYTVAGTISGSGALRFTGGGAASLTGPSILAGTTTIDAGSTLRSSVSSTSTLQVTGVLSGAGAIDVTSGVLLLTNTGNTISGTMAVENGAILQVGSRANNDVTLAGSTGTAAITVRSGGKIQWVAADGLGQTAANAITLDGGTLGTNSYFNSVTLTGTLTVNSGGGSIYTTNGKSFVLNGLLSGSGALDVQTTNYGGGGNPRVFINNAANSFSGMLTLHEDSKSATNSAIVLGASTALGYATVNLAPSDSSHVSRNQITYASGVNAVTFAGLSGNAWGGMVLQNGANAVALTLNQAADTTFAGVLSGTGSLTKNGPGSLTLTGANTYAGPTKIGGGTLALDFSAGNATANIIAASSALNLTGGTLRITGVAGQNGVVQTFAGLNVLSGSNTLQLLQNGATTLDVSIGALTLGGGTINFVGLTGITAGARVITTTNAGANDAMTQLSATDALWNGSGWASVQASGGVNYLTQWAGSYADVYTNAAGGPTVIPNGATPADVRILDGGANTVHNTLAASQTTLASLIMVSEGNSCTIDMNPGDRLIVGTSAIGNLAIGASGKSLTLGQVAGQGSLTAGTSGAATLNLSNLNAAATLTVNADITDNGSGAVALTTGGVVTLNGDLSYSGSTTVTGGSTLTLANRLGGGAYAANIVNNGVLNLNGAGVQNFAGILSGSGATTVRNGTLRLGLANALAEGAVNFIAGATLDLNGNSAGTAAITLEGVNALANGSATRGSILNLTLSADTSIDNTNDILIGSTSAANGVFSLAGHTLTKNGSGMLVLNGVTASGAGNIILNAGTLRLIDYGTGERSTTLSGAGSITINSGAILDTTHWATSFILSKDIVLNGGAISSAWPGANGAVVDSNVSVQSASRINGDGFTFKGVISGGANLTFSGGTNTITAANTLTGDTLLTAGTLKLANALALQNSTLSITGSGTAAFDSGVSSNAFTLGGLAGTRNLALQNNAPTPAAIALSVGNNNQDTTYSGALSGAGSLAKNGSGVLTLTGANTHSGGTTINTGTLMLGAGGVAGSGAVIVNSGGVFAFGAPGALTVTNAISGTGTLSQTGAGKTTLSGASTFSGAANVSAGTLLVSGSLGDAAISVGAGGAFGGSGTVGSSVTKAASLTFLSGSTLQYSGGALSLNGDLTFSGATTLGFDTTPVNGTLYTLLNYTGSLVGSSNLTTAYRGTIDSSVAHILKFTSGGAADLTWMGATNANWGSADGNLNFVRTASPTTADNFYTGDTVTFDDTSSVKNVTLNGALTPVSVTVNTTGAYVFNGAGAIGGTTALTKSGTGSLTLNTVNTYTGDTTVNAGTLRIGGSGSLGNGAYAGAIIDNGTLEFATSANQVLSGALSGSGALIRSGAGALEITAASTFTGTVSVTGGTLKVSNFSGTGLNTIMVDTGGTLIVNAGNGKAATGNQAITIKGAGIAATTGLYISGGTNLDTAGGLTLDTAATTIRTAGSGAAILSQINGTGIIVKAAASGSVIDSNIQVGGTNGYYGNTFGITINTTAGANTATGDLEIQGTLRQSTGSNLKTAGTGSVAVSGVSSAYTTGQLSVGGTSTLMFTGAASLGGGTNSGNHSVNTGATLAWKSSADQGLSGVISGAGRLVMAGSGTLSLSGANTYSGGATISSGTLRTANNTALGAGAGAVHVENGGTLQIGDGVTNGVTLGAGAKLVMDAGSTLKLGDATANIAMAGAGTFTLTSGMKLDISDLGMGSGLSLGQSAQYTLVTGSAAGGTVGTWSASSHLIGGNLANYSYALALSGNNAVFTVTAVPEPATYGLLGAGALAAAAFVRRRRSGLPPASKPTPKA